MAELNFKIAPELLAFWKEIAADPAAAHFAYGPVARMDADDFEDLSERYGQAMPEAFVAFHETYGSVWWPETGEGDQKMPAFFTMHSETRGHRGTWVDVMVGMVGQRRLHASHVAPPFATSANPDRACRLPPDMIPVAATAPGELILMTLGTEPGALWFWGSQSRTPWGAKDNTDIFWVAPSLPEFLAGLRVSPDPEEAQ